ncbi:MAG: hypothetical protein DDT20_01825 [Firmicutes bacterium]|nr:hypothetical protein [Bacillota bacterium]
MARLSKTLKKIDIDERIERLRAYVDAHPSVAAAFIFGSYGTKYQNPLSDLDIAVLLVPGSDLRSELASSIGVELSALTDEEDTNLVVLNSVPITLQFEVLATGRLLCKKGLYLEDFHEFVCKRFADFKIDLDAMYADYDNVLREGYLRGE